MSGNHVMSYLFLYLVCDAHLFNIGVVDSDTLKKADKSPVDFWMVVICIPTPQKSYKIMTIEL